MSEQQNTNTQKNANNQAVEDAASNPNEPQITPEIENFYRRADAIIELANSQLSPESHSGHVGASLLYASARYSASVASIGFVKGTDLAKEKEEIVKFYTKQFEQMLRDNIDDYAQNFDKYVQFNQTQSNQK